MNTNKPLLCTIALLTASYTAHALSIVDADSDGLIEISSLDDLNEMRNSLNGASLRGSTVGCPNNVCWGYELTRNLDFDTNGNDVIDAGDWNGGQPWVPVGDTNTPFIATFNGNGHTLSHLTISSSNNASSTGHGLFGATQNAVIRSLGLLDLSITVLDNFQRLGAVTGVAHNSQIKDVYVERGLVQGHSSGSLTIGGLAGLADSNSEISNSHFSGAVSGNHAGGLVGYLDRSTVLSSYASGQVTGSTSAAGLIDNLKNSRVSSSYSNAQVTSNLSAAGLITFATYDDPAQNGTDSALIESSYALGAITVQSRNAGGLINSLATYNDALATIVNSYSKNVITVNTNAPEYYATLIKSYVLQGGISITRSYWVKDPNGAVLANNGTNVGSGELLADMQCASNPVNNNCANPMLLSNWDNAVWDFGTTAQLPALKLKSNNPWMSTDTPGGNGDYETIARIKERQPEYACDAPTAFYAKEKNKSYVFNAKTPDVLRYFSGSKGLTCVHADQTSGSCANYEVSFFCGDTGTWTAWQSNDTPNGTGDYESYTSGCSATPTSVRARGVGKTTVYYSPQQKLSAFNLIDGLTCLNSDNACKDYEVRMTCEVLGDR